MKICVLGNSHVACLMAAWTEMRESHGDVDMTFFSSRGRRLESLQLMDGVLKSSEASVASDISFTSGGLDCIRLEDFDVFLVQGLLRVPRVSRFLSSAVVEQCCEDAVAHAENARICRMIRGPSERRVYAGHTPLFALRTAASMAVPYARLYAFMAPRLAAEGIALLRQPEETLLDTWGTRAEFLRGAERLDLGDLSPAQRSRAHDDQSHMNAAFGRLMLSQFLRLVAPKA